MGGVADPCLMMKKSEKGIVYMAIWVDDCLLIGDQAAIDQAIIDIEGQGFKLKKEGLLKDYLSCKITFAGDKEKGWIHQAHLIKKLENKFGKKVMNLQKCKTPGTPGMVI